MMRNNALIKCVAAYHPSNAVKNKYFIDMYESEGNSISGLLKASGRENRYIADNTAETCITMGFNAARTLLDGVHVRPQDITMLVFSSGTPEYLIPPNAVKLHNMLGLAEKCCCYDLNSACGGMLVAMEQAARAMSDNPAIRYALVIGSDTFPKFSVRTNALTYPMFGDSGCAVLLENVYDTGRGMLDSEYYTESDWHDYMVFPVKGMSNALLNGHADMDEKLFRIDEFDFSRAFHSATVSVENILFRNGMSTKDVKKYFISQFALSSIKDICRELDEDMDKFVFVGNEYGYTGVTSPFLAFKKAVDAGELQKGDNLIFWTVGGGFSSVCLLYKY